jgi:hypothetical protein
MERPVQLSQLFNFFRPARPVAAPASTVRALSDDEVQAVSGGLPKGGWGSNVVEPGSTPEGEPQQPNGGL